MKRIRFILQRIFLLLLGGCNNRASPVSSVSDDEQCVLLIAAGILADEWLKPVELHERLCTILGENSEFGQDYFTRTANAAG